MVAIAMHNAFTITSKDVFHNVVCDTPDDKERWMMTMKCVDDKSESLHLFRHPEVRAKRASKGDGPSQASFEGRFAATSG